MTVAPPAPAPEVEEHQADAPPWRQPLIATALLGAASAYVFAVDPNKPGHYPLCPTRSLFGVDCPMCGGLRATHDLLHGHVVSALDHNALVVPLLPIVGIALLGWLASTLGVRVPKIALPRWVAPALVVLMVVFAVVRNLPWAPVNWLGSGV